LFEKDEVMRSPGSIRSRMKYGVGLQLAITVILCSLLCGCRVALAQEAALPEQDATEVFFAINAGSPISQVRSLAFTRDSKRLCLAGLDKVVHVIPASAEDQPQAEILRWEIEWGPLGSIHALVREPHSDVVVVAGFGYRGALGDLAWLDTATGRLMALEHHDDGEGDESVNGQPGTVLFQSGAEQQRFETVGHLQPVASMSASALGNWIVSSDYSGRVVARSRSHRAHLVLQAEDALSYAPLRPVTVVGDRIAALPRYVDGGQTDFNTATWQLELYDLEASRLGNRLTRVGQALKPAPQGALLTSLAGSPDGRWLVAGDLRNRLHVWDLSAQPVGSPLSFAIPDRVALALAFHPQEPVVLVGTQTNRGQGQILLLDLERRTWPGSFAASAPVTACTFSPDGQRFACATLDRRVLVAAYADKQLPPQALPTPALLGKAYLDVTGGQHQLVYSARRPSEQEGSWYMLALDTLAWERVSEQPAVAAPKATWQVSSDRQVAGLVRLSRPGHRGATIRYDASLHGRVGATAELQIGGVPAIAMAMEHSHEILVYRLMDQGECPLLRIFWGHNGTILSLRQTTEQAGRFLISTSEDGTARVWSLEHAVSENAILRRWGARFTVVGDELRIAHLDDNGPLFNKGARVGDTIREIQWVDPASGQQRRRATDPPSIQDALQGAAPHTIVAFLTERAGQRRPIFQVLDGWYHLLGFLAVAEEWIAWHPTGYYACSAGGERLIGWQLNNRLGEPPSFFEAARFSKVFYRPEVIRKVLSTGNITEALAMAGGRPVREVPAIAAILPPRVEVSFPDPPTQISPGTPLQVRARVSSRSDEPIGSVQLHVNGRPTGPPLIVKASGPEVEVDFKVNLNSGKNSIAATADTASSQGISRPSDLTVGGQPARPSLFALAIGVSHYQDKVYDLDSPDDDARTLAKLLRERYASGKYDRTDVRLLIDSEATRAGIESELERMMKDMKYGDVGVIFFSGHGFSEDGFYLAPFDFNKDQLESTCISDKRLGEYFYQSQNQLLLILNACHAGAADPIKLQQTRELGTRLGRDDYSVMLLASSPSSEQTIQGAFSSVLFEALSGKADQFREFGVVETFELPPYLKSEVGHRTQGRQVPVDSNLTNFRSFPLTQADNSLAMP